MPGVGFAGAADVEVDQLVQQGLEDVAGADAGIGGDREAELAGDGEAEPVGFAARRAAPSAAAGARPAARRRRPAAPAGAPSPRPARRRRRGSRSAVAGWREGAGRLAPGAASALAPRAPVGGAVGVALAARGDRAAAGRAGALAAFVDLEAVAVAASRPRSASARGRRQSTARSSSSERSPTGRQGSTRAAKQASLLKMLPMPATRCWSSRASPRPRVGSARIAGDHAVEVEVRRRGCRGRAGSAAGCGAGARSAHTCRVGPPNWTASQLAAREHRPGRGARPPPAGAGPVEVPAAAHPQVAVQGEVAEAEQQVLAVRLDALEACGRRAVRSRPPCRAGSAPRPPPPPPAASPRSAAPAAGSCRPLPLPHHADSPRWVGWGDGVEADPKPPAGAGRSASAGWRSGPASSSPPGRRCERWASARPTPPGEALAKLGGGRDLALGALTLAARDDPRGAADGDPGLRRLRRCRRSRPRDLRPPSRDPLRRESAASLRQAAARPPPAGSGGLALSRHSHEP